MLYLHGGLNDESEVAKRIVAFRDVLPRERDLPAAHHVGVGRSSRPCSELLRDLVHRRGRPGGVADWLRKLREGLIEAKDRTLELTAAGAGHARCGAR